MDRCVQLINVSNSVDPDGLPWIFLQEYEKSLKNTEGQPPLELVTLFNSLARMHQERESYTEARHAMLLMVQVYEMRGITRQAPNTGLAKVRPGLLCL